MFGWTAKRKFRRRHVREQRVKTTGTARTRLISRVFSWPVAVTVMFVVAATVIALVGDAGLDYAVGQRIDQPIYAKVDFQILDPAQTEDARKSARAQTPSSYTVNPQAITVDRVRSDLMRVYQAAGDADDYEAFAAAMKPLKLPADASAYRALRGLVDLPDDAGRKRLAEWIDRLPLRQQYVVRGLFPEDRDTPSTTEYILLNEPGKGETATIDRVPYADLIYQGSEKALRGSAAVVARMIPRFELRPMVEAIVLAALREQPTILFDAEGTRQALQKAADATPDVMIAYARGEPFVHPSVLGSQDFARLEAHHAAFTEFLKLDLDDAKQLRQERWLRRVGLSMLVAALSIGLLMYVAAHRPRIFEVRTRTLAFTSVILATLVLSRFLVIHWPDAPELVLAPSLFVAIVLAIAYPQRFAMGAMCITTLLVAVLIHADLVLLITLFTGVVVVVFQLDDIRTRTKLITSGSITALAIALTSTAGGLWEAHSAHYVWVHAGSAASCALLATFAASGLLPFVERLFRIATSLTLLEWRDPTKKLLQLLAREAPGTYNHSLVLGTLSEAACERIGANGLLAQVGALYHDIGKIPKADYFTENQVGSASRHDNLAPTMSLLIILGHVKDGAEMAKEYKLPRVLHQFIEEHHGTTVVRYFHHVASEKKVAQGKHDREVSEAEFRYSGPKPRTKESAVLMLCDGVEGAVRSLHEPNVGRIEGVVHQIVMDRLNDGQLDACDITLREIHVVEESLVKSLCSLYHGRVAYPKKPELKIATGQ